jgi:hypothetical protein
LAGFAFWDQLSLFKERYYRSNAFLELSRLNTTKSEYAKHRRLTGIARHGTRATPRDVIVLDVARLLPGALMQQFSLDRAQFDAKVKEIADETGIKLVGDSGSVEIPKTSMVVKYTYDGATLQVDIEGGDFVTRKIASEKLEAFFKTA